MKISLNKIFYNNFEASLPPPIPRGVKAAVKSLSPDDWEDFFFIYWAHYITPHNQHLIKDVPGNVSLGVKSSPDYIKLNGTGRAY